MTVAIALLGMGALTACVRYEARPLSAEASRATMAGRTLNDPGLRAFLASQKATGEGWTLDRLALAATYFHPDVALARAEAREAAAAVVTARMIPNPVLTVSPQYASNRITTVSPWVFFPVVSIPIETAGKRSRRTEQALAAAEAAQWRVSARAWAARSRVRAAMLELHGARENVALLETEQLLHDEALKKLTAQMDAGEVSPFELTQARLMSNRSRLALQDARRLSATGQARLAAAIGIPLTALQAVSLDFSAFTRLPAVSVERTRRRALTQRADLMALLAEYTATESALRLEIARQYPDLRLNPGYDYNLGQNRWQLGLNLELPINRNAGPIAQAEARRATAERRFLALQGTIEGELDIALAAYEASREKARIAGALARDAAAAADATRCVLGAGEVSALELTRRRIEASSANVALLAAQIEAQTAAGALEDAMQAILRFP